MYIVSNGTMKWEPCNNGKTLCLKPAMFPAHLLYWLAKNGAWAVVREMKQGMACPVLALIYAVVSPAFRSVRHFRIPTICMILELCFLVSQ
jgi:hypothetical protein